MKRRDNLTINTQMLNSDIEIIINTFEKLMFNLEKKIFPVKSCYVTGLSLFEDIYIRSRTGSLSMLGKPVLVVSSISVLYPQQGCFSALLSRLKLHCIANSYILKIESVIAPELRSYLKRQRFVFVGEEWECGSGYWMDESESAYVLLNTLPF